MIVLIINIISQALYLNEENGFAQQDFQLQLISNKQEPSILQEYLPQMNQANQMSQMNVNELSSKFKSKKELYQFLVQDCQAYLPPLASTNIYFFKQVMRGEKDYIKRDKAMVSAVPQIEGLTIENILDSYKGKGSVLKHIPDERDWVHIDRKWLCDILYTLDKSNFQDQIQAALKKRKDKVEQSRDLLVQMRPEFAQAFQNCLNFSHETGRSANLLKGSSKRKRTKAELDDVRGEEEELKDDKHGFLQQVKRLKLENADMQQILTDLRNGMQIEGGEEEQVQQQVSSFQFNI